MERHFDLFSESHSDRGSRSIWLRATEDGGLVLEGQDLGGFVGKFFGNGITEYEWAWTVPPDRLHLLLEALGVPRDVTGSSMLLERVGHRLKTLEASDMQRHFKEAGAEFWSRVGD